MKEIFVLTITNLRILLLRLFRKAECCIFSSVEIPKEVPRLSKVRAFDALSLVGISYSSKP